MGGEECPSCSHIGSAVELITVRHLSREGVLPPDARGPFFVCFNPECEVVYFSPNIDLLLRRSDIKVPVWFKDPDWDVPLCYCNMVTRRQIHQAIQGGCPPKLKDIMDQTGAGKGGLCDTTNPAGECCHGAIREFIRNLTYEPKI